MQKIALVTGGSRGIGLEVCRQLAEAGIKVFQGTRKEIKSKNENLLPVQLDVTHPSDIKSAVDRITMDVGKLDILVNNAGISIDSKRLISVPEKDFRSVLETNFFGPFNMVQHFLPLLRKSSDARIINVSSRMGKWDRLTGGYGAYRTSKVGLNALTVQFASELMQDNIKVYSVCPGWVKTDMGGKGASVELEDGADTIVWLALEKGIATGKFYAERKEVGW